MPAERGLKWRCGVVFALYSLYETQPEPIEHVVNVATQRCLDAGVDNNELLRAQKHDAARPWRIAIPLTPGQVKALLELRTALLGATLEADDPLHILRLLAERVDYCAEDSGARAARPVAAPEPPSEKLVDAAAIRNDVKKYQAALKRAGCAPCSPQVADLGSS